MRGVAPDFLFVYGTLLRGQTAPLSRALEQFGEFLGAATVEGELYSMGRYPGFADSKTAGGAAVVRGELFRVTQIDLWRAFDAYEGPEYERVVRRATLVSTGEVIEAWIYRYVGDLAERVRIESGDWRAFSQEQPR